MKEEAKLSYILPTVRRFSTGSRTADIELMIALNKLATINISMSYTPKNTCLKSIRIATTV
jgi:hypothetical protein